MHFNFFFNFYQLSLAVTTLGSDHCACYLCILLRLFLLTFCVIRFLCRAAAAAAAAAEGAGQREIGGGCGQLGHQGLDHVSPVAQGTLSPVAGKALDGKSLEHRRAGVTRVSTITEITVAFLAPLLCVFVLTFPWRERRSRRGMGRVVSTQGRARQYTATIFRDVRCCCCTFN